MSNETKYYIELDIEQVPPNFFQRKAEGILTLLDEENDKHIFLKKVSGETTGENEGWEDKIEMLIRIGAEKDKENERLKGVIEKELRYYFWELHIVALTCDQVEAKWQQYKIKHELY